MLRLIHAQTVTGGLLVDDVDDGLPNKEVYRFGSNANPKSYKRDGYANLIKQPCYVPRVKATDTTIAGYIDLKQTERVLLSAGKGKIKKLQTAGLVSVVSFVASDLNAPTLSIADKDTPGAGDLTLTGTNMLSVLPNITKVIITGSGAITLTATQITTGGGTVSNTSFFIPAALVPGIATGTSSAKVTADDQSTAVVALS